MVVMVGVTEVVKALEANLGKTEFKDPVIRRAYVEGTLQEFGKGNVGKRWAKKLKDDKSEDAKKLQALRQKATDDYYNYVFQDTKKLTEELQQKKAAELSLYVMANLFAQTLYLKKDAKKLQNDLDALNAPQIEIIKKYVAHLKITFESKKLPDQIKTKKISDAISAFEGKEDDLVTLYNSAVQIAKLMGNTVDEAIIDINKYSDYKNRQSSFAYVTTDEGLFKQQELRTDLARRCLSVSDELEKKALFLEYRSLLGQHYNYANEDKWIKGKPDRSDQNQTLFESKGAVIVLEKARLDRGMLVYSYELSAVAKQSPIVIRIPIKDEYGQKLLGVEEILEFGVGGKLLSHIQPPELSGSEGRYRSQIDQAWLAKLKQDLKSYVCPPDDAKFKRITVRGDGNCLFASFKEGLRLSGRNAEIADLRKIVFDALQTAETKERFKEGIINEILDMVVRNHVNIGTDAFKKQLVALRNLGLPEAKLREKISKDFNTLVPEYVNSVTSDRFWGGEVAITILTEHYHVQTNIHNPDGSITSISVEEDGSLSETIDLDYDGSSHYNCLEPRPITPQLPVAGSGTRGVPNRQRGAQTAYAVT